MKNATIEPYLFFSGRCEEALSFYRDAIGAEIAFLMRFKESPEAPPPGMVPEGYGEKVMHSTFRVGSATIMASDGCDPTAGFAGFALALNLNSTEAVDQAFHALAEGGQITMPLGQTFWSPRFGMLTDRFGIGWMVGVAPEQ